MVRTLIALTGLLLLVVTGHAADLRNHLGYGVTHSVKEGKLIVGKTILCVSGKIERRVMRKHGTRAVIYTLKDKVGVSGVDPTKCLQHVSAIALIESTATANLTQLFSRADFYQQGLKRSRPCFQVLTEFDDYWIWSENTRVTLDAKASRFILSQSQTPESRHSKEAPSVSGDSDSDEVQSLSAVRLSR